MPPHKTGRVRVFEEDPVIRRKIKAAVKRNGLDERRVYTEWGGMLCTVEHLPKEVHSRTRLYPKPVTPRVYIRN